METRRAAGESSNRSAAQAVSLFLMINTFETGGSERQFAVLAKNLSPEEFQVHLGCIRRDGPFASDFGPVPEFRLGGSLWGWKSLGARLALRRHLLANRVEIAHAFDFYANLTLIPAARLARVRVVIGSHRQLGDLLTPAQFRAQASAFRWADAVVCNSRAAADRLAAHGLPREKLFVIGNALPEEAFVPAREGAHHLRGTMCVGMVARMNARYKNHSGFLRIAAKVLQRVPNVDFLLAGDGPLRDELEKEAQTLGLAKHVFFLGDRRDITAVLASMNVAVLTSTSESLSNVILEAMAAGLPVVAYDVGGNRELVTDKYGALVPAGDEDGFAAAIARLLENPDERKAMGRAAHVFVQQNFSLSRVRHQYEDLYDELLRKKGRRTPAK